MLRSWFNMALKGLTNPLVTSVLTSLRTRKVLRAAAERLRQLRSEPHKVYYFHQLDDPYSHLTAQVLERFSQRFQIKLVPNLVGPPEDSAAPEREKLVAYSRMDAAAVAPHFDLSFEDSGCQPDPEHIQLAAGALAALLDSNGFAQTAAQIGKALWAGDEAALHRFADGRSWDQGPTRKTIEEGTALRKKFGHYLGATFFYGGEWYWGIDRLHYLEERLTDLGLRRSGHGPLFPPPEGLAPAGSGSGLSLEVFPSLRSPYSAIAMQRAYEMADRTGAQLNVRPVLPMVMRGLPVPLAKRLYILMDTNREAERLRIPFGRICDPVGRPVFLAFSVYPLACQRGREREFLLAFYRAVWSQGVDAGSEKGLRSIVEAAGLDWKEAKARLGDDSSKAELEANRRRMFELGLWGVPSYVLSDRNGSNAFKTWGQDRLWLVEAEIARRAGKSVTT